MKGKPVTSTLIYIVYYHFVIAITIVANENTILVKGAQKVYELTSALRACIL